MRKFLKNEHGDINMILGAVTVAILLAISIIIVWNVIAASTPSAALEEAVCTAAGRNTTDNTPVANVSVNLETNVGTFYTVGPIVLVVMAAVGILGYVMLLRRGR